MKGKVLSVDAASSRATITLKRSMLKDKRPPITTYEEVKYSHGRMGYQTRSFVEKLTMFFSLFKGVQHLIKVVDAAT